MPDRTPQRHRWRAALESGLFGTWDLDLPREMVHYSPQWKARLGFPRIHEPDSTGFWRCRVHPEDVGPMLNALRRHFDGKSATYEHRFRLRSNGSGYRTMLSRGRVVAHSAAGRATRMVGTMVDLTPRAMSAAAHSLATEDPQDAIGAYRPPFHAMLGIDPTDPLMDAVGDLLDRALHEVAA